MLDINHFILGFWCLMGLGFLVSVFILWDKFREEAKRNGY